RGSRVKVAWPKSLLEMFVLKALNWVWFQRLYDSMRTCRVPPSGDFGRGIPVKFLNTEKSKLLMPCPRTLLRALSPKEPGVSAVKAAMLNHSAWVRGPVLGLPIRLARYPPQPQWAISPDCAMV